MATLDEVIGRTMLHTAMGGMFFKDAAPDAQHFEDDSWRYDLRYDGSQIKIENLEAMAHGHHDMWMRVCDGLHWGTPLSAAWANIPGVDGPVTLAFEKRYLLRWYGATKGGRIAASNSGAWQLE